MAGTNKRPFNGRAILVLEAADNNSYQVVTLSSVTFAGSSLTATAAAPTTFTDANFVAYLKQVFGL